MSEVRGKGERSGCRSYEWLVRSRTGIRSRSRVGLRFGDAGEVSRKLIAEWFFPAEVDQRADDNDLSK